MWCEACQDNFDEDHYEEYLGKHHKIGPEYGPTGRELALRVLVREFIGRAQELLP